MYPINTDELFKRKQFNDAIDPEKQVSYKQAEYFNSNSTQLDQDAAINLEAQTEYASVNTEQQEGNLTVEA